MWHLLIGMWRRKAMVFAIVAGITGLVFLVVSIMPSRYEAETRVLLESGETAFTAAEGQSLPQLADRLTVQSQVEVMRSRDLALRVVDTLGLKKKEPFSRPLPRGPLTLILVGLGLKPDPARLTLEERVLWRYYEGLAVEPVRESRVVAIYFTHKDPLLAADIANELARHYIAGTREASMENTRQAIDWLSEQIATLRQRVIQAETAAERFRNRAGLVKGGGETLQSQQLAQLNSQIVLAAANRAEAQARARAIREMLERKGAVDSANDVVQSPLIQRLVEQKVALKRQMADLSSTLLPSHPRMVRLKAEVDDLDRQIRAEARKIVDALENQARVAGAREASLRGSLEKLKLQAASSTDEDVQLRALEREATANRELLESLLKRYRAATARNDLEAQPAGARIISHASPPSTPTSPKRAPIVLLGFVASFVLALLVTFLREVFVLSAHGAPLPAPASAGAMAVPPPELAPEPVLPVPAPGSGLRNSAARPRRPVPPKPGEPDHVVALSDAGFEPDSLAAFAHDLSERCREAAVKRIVVTAPQPLAAKSALVAALARHFARDGLRTVAVDADLHGTPLAGDFGFTAGRGLSEVLRGEATFAEALVSRCKGGPELLRQGLRGKVAAGLIDSERTDIVLDALDYAYDVILISAPELGLHREAAALVGRDAVVLGVSDSGRAGERWRARFAEAADDLGARVVASVMLARQGGSLGGIMRRLRPVHETV